MGRRCGVFVGGEALSKLAMAREVQRRRATSLASAPAARSLGGFVSLDCPLKRPRRRSARIGVLCAASRALRFREPHRVRSSDRVAVDLRPVDPLGELGDAEFDEPALLHVVLLPASEAHPADRLTPADRRS
jgi:hypothetical protein